MTSSDTQHSKRINKQHSNAGAPTWQGLLPETDTWEGLSRALDFLGCIEPGITKAEFKPYQAILEQAQRLLEGSDPDDGMRLKLEELEAFDAWMDGVG
ncbi:hypothetical protein CVFO_0669 [Isorropodon fossajaponicum endosymbiont JTNG4]|uniref:hypothetical protein n=1 Tax=Isorropodon fossajaponicum symbiont TaxID=883811 RepID=UPI001915C338|nr:hypothetical protein [Isorropodon fossajaponicum symbiont]BBB23900.1 hypothetical protein CVFO_0669 [Isorropodon fossajaponicum endosymbiont JTNG4]